MGMRFSKRIKIAPGVRVSFGLRGSSVSLGPRGANINIGSRGVYSNVGIPGSGLSYRSQLNGGVRAQQRRDRELIRLEKEQRRQQALAQLRLSLLDTGSIEITDAFGMPLNRRDTQLMWEQKGDHIRNWLDGQVEKINGDVELLSDIHLDTPAPNTEPEYWLQQFSEALPEEPTAPLLPRLGWIARWFKSKRLAHESKVQFMLGEHDAAKVHWLTRRNEWEEKRRTFEMAEAARAEKFPQQIRSDIRLMEDHLEQALESMDWPRETLVSFNLFQEGALLSLDVDLPEIEDMPDRVATLAQSRKKLSIKQKPKTQLQLEYARHIHGILFRLLGACFAALPSLQQIVISGYSQRMDPSTGKEADEYLLSARVSREDFSEVDFFALENVDPIVAIDRFQPIRKMTKTGLFKAITPLLPG